MRSILQSVVDLIGEREREIRREVMTEEGFDKVFGGAGRGGGLNGLSIKKMGFVLGCRVELKLEFV